jgi:hypothetical protein
MKLHTNKSSIVATAGFYLLLDNDFLSEVFWDEEVLNEFLNIFESNYFLIDPLTKFEFLRDIFEPKQRKLKEAFISHEIFLPVPNRQEIFMKLWENAMLLSILYSHNGSASKSMVDLFLGARCMLNAGSILVVTGNKKDFPSSIFDICAVINIEQNNGVIKPYCVLRFNKEKFENCQAKIKKLEERYEKSIEKLLTTSS